MCDAAARSRAPTARGDAGRDPRRAIALGKPLIYAVAGTERCVRIARARRRRRDRASRAATRRRGRRAAGAFRRPRACPARRGARGAARRLLVGAQRARRSAGETGEEPAQHLARDSSIRSCARSMGPRTADTLRSSFGRARRKRRPLRCLIASAACDRSRLCPCGVHRTRRATLEAVHPYPAWPFLSDPAHPFLSAVWAVLIHGAIGIAVVAPLVWREPPARDLRRDRVRRRARCSTSTTSSRPAASTCTRSRRSAAVPTPTRSRSSRCSPCSRSRSRAARSSRGRCSRSTPRTCSSTRRAAASTILYPFTNLDGVPWLVCPLGDAGVCSRSASPSAPLGAGALARAAEGLMRRRTRRPV